MKLFIRYFCFLSVFAIVVYGQNKTVYHAKISEEIDLGLAPFVQRVVTEAEKNNASLIIFEINTFGGRVDAATQIKDAILNSKIPTAAFVNKRAISAGALISLACKNIAMAPGSSIGASTVVNEQGEKVSEKYQSYMRSEMRSTAERNGRPVHVAEAMVDERIVVEGLDDSTTLVTLTAEEALTWGITDTVVNSLRDVAESFGYKNATITTVEIGWAEKFVRFLNNPVVSSILILLGTIGLYTEIKTPGWGVAGFVGVFALVLFFGSSYILDLAAWYEIIIFVIGVSLLIVEIFVIPGFGIPGIIGVALMILGLFLSLINMEIAFDIELLYTALIQLGSSLSLSLLAMFALYKFLPKTHTFKTMVLETSIGSEEGYVSSENYSFLVGKEGICSTPLRPAGIAVIDGKRMDVVSQGDFLEKDAAITVIAVEGSKIIVTKL